MPSQTVKHTLAAIAFLGCTLVPARSAFGKTHDYPMRLQVIHSRWHGRRGWANGYGHGNLITQQAGQPPEQGVDFEYVCSSPVRHTFAPDTYPARYGKNNLELVVLLPELGSDKEKECTLKIEMKDFVYRGGRGGALWSVPLAGGPPAQLPPEPEGPQ